MDRRGFAQGVAALIAAPLLTARGAAASASPSDDFGEKPEDLSAAEWGEVQARFSNLLRVYGERLSPEQRHTLLNVLLGNERMLASIRRFAVQNSDPAALTLRLVVNGKVS